MLLRAALLALLVAGCPAPATPRPAQRPTLQALPPLLSLEGARRTLAEVTAGRPALVSLWATWCEPCLAEFPALQRFAQQAQGAGAVGVAIAVGEPRAQVAAFVQRNGLAYTHLVDEDFRLADALGQRRVPTTLVLDGAGRVVYVGGAFDGAALAALRALLPAAP